VSSTRLLHLRRLRQQPLRTAVAVVAVTAGVALLAGVTIARASIGTSIERYTSGIAGAATLRVVGPVDHGGIQESTVARVAAVPGVEEAVPLVIARAIGVDSAGGEQYVTSIGVDCSIESVIGAFECDEASFAAIPVALSPRLAASLGPDGVLRTDGGAVPVRGAVTVASLDGFNDGEVAVWPLREAQARFTRPERLDAILVVPEDGAAPDVLRAGVEDAAGPTNKVVDAADPFVDSDIIDQLLVGLLLASLLGLVVGGQLVHNTLLLTFEERRQELALMGAVGATPRRVARGVMTEALLLGGVGGLLGAGLGVVVARAFVSSLSEQAERTEGLHLGLHVGAADVAIAVAVGMAAAAIGALKPARRAARLDLAGELAGRRRQEVTATGSSLLTIALVVGTTVGVVLAWAGSRGGSLETWQPGATVIGMGMTFTCAFPLPGRIAPRIVDALARSAGRRTGLVRVAHGNLMGDPARTRAVTTAFAIAVSVAVTLGALVPSIEAGGRADAANRGGGAVVTVSAVPVNNASGVDAKLTEAEETALAGIDGVSEVRGSYLALVSHPSVGLISLEAVDGPPPRYTVYRGGDAARVLAAGHVMIGPALARSHGLAPGDRFSFPAVSGPVTLTVGGVWASPSGVGRSLGVSHDEFDRLVGPRPPMLVQLVPEGGVSTAELASEVRAAGFGPHVRILTPDELADLLAREYRAFAEPFRALQLGLLAVAFTATASTLLLVAVQRRREHALLAAMGLAPRGLGAMALVEVLILAVIAIATGALAGLLGAVTFAWASGVLTGLAFPAPLTLSPLPAAAGIVLLVAGAATALPALRFSRINPAIALREE
jgi:putative ABC transport system permease protein